MTTEDGKIESLAHELRERIKHGEFGTSGRLPSVTQLAKEYQASRSTIYQALLLLRSEGVVFVKDTSYFVNYPILQISGMPFFDNYLRRQGLTPVVNHLIEPEIVPMPADIAKMFGQQEGVHVVHRTIKHGTTQIPLRLIDSWYPADLAGQFIEEIKRNPSLNVAAEIKRVHGIAMKKIHEDVASRLPTADEIQQLSIARTIPVIDIKRHCYSKDDKPVIFSHVILVAAYFTLNYDYELPD
jgi:DNA-binding GntR family transcriptional regulator